MAGLKKVVKHFVTSHQLYFAFKNRRDVFIHVSFLNCC